MSVLVYGAVFMALGIWFILYVFFRAVFFLRFVELALAFGLALLLKNLGWADELAYFALGMTLALAYFLRKI